MALGLQIENFKREIETIRKAILELKSMVTEMVISTEDLR